MAETITIPSPSVFLRKSPPPTQAATSKPNAPKHVRRSSAVEAKKKTARKSAGLVNGADGGVVKPKQSKSRNGCVTCKLKRLKCGEEKPGCQQCARRNVECGGYKKDFKWRPFEETNVKVNIDKQKRGTSPKQFSEDAKPVSPVSASSHNSADADDGPKQKRKSKKDSVTEVAAGPTQQRPPQRPATLKQKQPSTGPDRSSTTPVDNVLDLEPPHLIPDLTESENSTTATISPEELQPNLLSPTDILSPSLADILKTSSLEDPADQDFISFDLPDDFQIPMPSDMPYDTNLTNDSMDETGIEEITKGYEEKWQDLPLLPGSRHGTPPPIRQLRSTNEVLKRSMDYIYPQPLFAEDSPEMLTLRFDRLTCGILSIMDGPNENPWRNLIWPLAQTSLALYHAVSAMTAFHSSMDLPQMRVIGHEHKVASIRYIQEGIRDNSMNVQTAIATALALGFSESWDTHTQTGNSHIKGAQVLVRRALNEHQQNPLTGVDLDRLKFLVNAWVYMDVIARLTSVDSDESNEFDNAFLFSSNPNEAPAMVMGDTDPGFGIDFGMPIDARLDPLMGCANTLFPLIGRVANLVRKVCRSTNNSPAVISQANDLKTALEGWDAPAYIERPEDPTTDVEHTLQTAEAYRWATLLHLHSSIPELPSLSSMELAQRVLQYLATVPLASRTVIVQIYPLMVAGCEAATAEDRQWVRSRWQAMHARMRIGIIEKSLAVTEEVWRRRDTYEAQPTSNRKLVATADLQPNRQRGQPLVRMSNGALRPGDPGRTGVVFSLGDPEEGSNSDGEDELKRRARHRRNGRDPRMRVMDPAYTVRGHLHWVGVMWDWGWEILLG